MNLNEINRRVFFYRADGKVYECFKEQPMIEIDDEIVSNLYLNGRKLNISIWTISEEQVNIYKNNLRDKDLVRNMVNPELVLEDYLLYGIMSKEEYEEFSKLINDQLKILKETIL